MRASYQRGVFLGCPALAFILTSFACSHAWNGNSTSDDTSSDGASTSSSGNAAGGGGGRDGCGAGETECGGACVDTRSDTQHCGACDRACAQGSPCDAGTCTCVGGPLQELGSMLPQVVDGTTVGAADSYVLACVDAGANDQVFRFTAPVDGTYVAEVIGANYDAALAVVAEDGCRELACNADPSSWQASASFELAAGRSAQVAVSGVGGAQGRFTLRMSRRVTCAPAELGATVPQSTAGSTVGAGDSVTSICGARGNPDATYTFTAPDDATYSFDTIGSGFNTVLEVFDGDCSGASLGCSDDAIDLLSQVLTPLRAGQTVVVAVGGADASGPYQLNVAVAAFGACAAIPLPSTVPLTLTGTTVGRAAALVPPCVQRGGPEVVYAFTAPTAGRYVFDTTGSAFDTVLYVRDGGCQGGDLGCNHDNGAASQSQLSLTLSAGQAVAVVVDGYNGAMGDYTLHIRN
jgi:hypothetical protein